MALQRALPFRTQPYVRKQKAESLARGGHEARTALGRVDGRGVDAEGEGGDSDGEPDRAMHGEEREGARRTRGCTRETREGTAKPRAWA